jgi:hemerythrin superfamily protein
MTENPAANPATDAVLNLVQAQHETLNKMLSNVQAANEAQRKAAMSSLERFLTAHEAAEQAYLEQANKQLENVESWVHKLSSMDYSSNDFTKQFAEFQKSLLSHTETEMTHTIPKALKDMTNAQIELVQSAFERVSRNSEPVDES